MTEFRLHVCPLCASPIEVEGGYDGPYYSWTCDHEHQLPYPLDQPARMSLAEWSDPAIRERLRSEATRRVWEQMHRQSEERREYLDSLDYRARYLDHPIKLPYWPQYRRQRWEWRQRSYTSQVHEILKRTYSEPLREHLQQHNLLFSVAMEDEMDAHLHEHRKLVNRIGFGDEFTVPIKRGDA